MISYGEAIALIKAGSDPLGTETVPLAEAAGRVVAAPIIAKTESPRSDVSAMDGYAVRSTDLGVLPASLRIVGESSPGTASNCTVGKGACARILTGAPVPPGADLIVIQEKVRRDDGQIIIDSEPGVADYIRKRGSDFRAGDAVIAAGRLLDPRALVAAAAADAGMVQVYRRPRLAILSTGDELAEPGSARDTPGAIPESISLGVAALAAQWGAQCVDRVRLKDDLRSMQRAAEGTVRTADVLVVTGGASVGDRDFAQAMFEPLGLELAFSKIAMKPGKPAWFGRVRETIVIGLPGNPTSAMVAARLLLAPLLARLRAQPVEEALGWRLARLMTPVAQCGERETFHRGRWNGEAVELLSFQDSGAQKALAEADLLVRQRANSPPLEAGDLVEVLDF